MVRLILLGLLPPPTTVLTHDAREGGSATDMSALARLYPLFTARATVEHRAQDLQAFQGGSSLVNMGERSCRAGSAPTHSLSESLGGGAASVAGSLLHPWMYRKGK